MAAESPPKLDGVLDEAWWKTDAAVRTSADDQADRAACVMLAYDDQFLYFAVTCPKTAEADYADDKRPRSHDADLAERDCVRLVLDADRDYATGFELTVDSRGWTAERCWEDAGWNPDWYVAPGAGNTTAGQPWTIEAAIPWSALASRAPQSGEAWACAVERLTPGAPRQDWAGAKADDEGPRRFGVLTFD